MTTERAINQISRTGRTATHDALWSFLFVFDGIVLIVHAVNKTEDFIRLDGLDSLMRKAKQNTKPGKQVHTSRLLSSGLQQML